MKSHITTYYLEEALLSQINLLDQNEHQDVKKSMAENENFRATVR